MTKSQRTEQPADTQSLVDGLQRALAHLYDPGYRPAPDILSLAGLDAHANQETLRQVLVREIESLEPEPDVPPAARSHRIYGLLYHLYVQAMTQEDAAERLGITARHLRRDRGDAVRILYQRMMDKTGPVAVPPELDAADLERQAADWQGQLQREIKSLQESRGQAITTDLGQAVAGAAEIAQALTRRRGVEIEISSTPFLVSVPIHRSIVRQVIFGAISDLSQTMTGGTLYVATEPLPKHRVRISICGEPADLDSLRDPGGVRDLIIARGGAVTFERADLRVELQIELPAIRRRVLVVDDNLDMVHLYGRYAHNTPYHLEFCGSGNEVLEHVAQGTPDIIMLDVMLPDIDGWELLSRLRQEPLTQTIPIAVCSVVREQALAEALGADAYLTKPIHRQAFLDTLDELALGLGEHDPG